MKAELLLVLFLLPSAALCNTGENTKPRANDRAKLNCGPDTSILGFPDLYIQLHRQALSETGKEINVRAITVEKRHAKGEEGVSSRQRTHKIDNS